MGKVRVYIAMSLDGFIAGPGDDLSWLPTEPVPETEAVTYEAFMAEVGAILMGRRTYDVVSGFDGPWPYGNTPVLVATHRPLGERPGAVEAASGSADALLDRALEVAGGADVYVDGGLMVQQALRAGRVDELIITAVPILLGGGTPLFGALTRYTRLRFEPPAMYGGMVQLRAVPEAAG